MYLDCQICKLGQFSRALCFPFFHWGREKEGSQQLVIGTQFSLACKSWLPSVCYPGHGPLAFAAAPGPRPALPDGCPLNSTNNQHETLQLAPLWLFMVFNHLSFRKVCEKIRRGVTIPVSQMGNIGLSEDT